MIRLNKYILFLIIFIAGSQVANAQRRVLTLQECLEIAINNNLNVKQAGTTLMTDSINYKQTRENLLPSLTGSVGRSLNQGRAVNPITNTYINQSLTSDSYGLNAGVTLFNGLALQNNIKQASLAYQAGKMDYQAAKDAVTVNIITGYLSILDYEESLAQSKSALAVAKETLDRLEILEKEGNNKAASDIYDSRGIYASNQVTVVTSQNSLDGAKLSLFQQMNIPYNKDAEFQPLTAAELIGEYGVSPDQVYETALQQLPIVKSAILKRQSAEKYLKVEKGLLLPTLSLSGGLNTNYSSASENISYFDQFKNNYSSGLSLGLSVPIFTNHIKKNNIALAKISLLNYQYVEENTKIVLRQNVEQAYYNMSSAYKRYQVLLDEVKAYTESFRISKIRFDAGVLTSVDFIISKNQLDAANLNLISARYDYFIYSKVLDYYQGKLNL
ncbi:MAG TPA: TolC family protein [Mucilaginibacter sp.]